MKLTKPEADILDLIVKSGSDNVQVAFAAQHELAKAIELPLRQGVMDGDLVYTLGVFGTMPLQPGAVAEWPLDLLAPGTEDEYRAFTNPGHGRIPERSVQGDYVMIPTYSIANAIDWLLKYARDARWDIVGRAIEVFNGGFVKKINDDAFHTLLAAGVDRNILVYDADATAGVLTKRLISLSKTVMARNAGGNTTSVRKGQLTDMIVSLEAVEDVRNWNLDQVDDATRREIYVAGDGATVLTKVFGVNLHPVMELGEGQEWQLYYTSKLAGTYASSDVELVIGLDLSKNDSFVMPVRQEIQVFEDPALHRQQRAGVYGWGEMGFGVLDNRRILLGSF